MTFPTELPFILPKGYRDAAGKLHREGTMRLATAKDEIAPLQDFRVKNNRAYLVVLILSRVVTRIGDLADGAVTPAVIECLYSSDLSYLQDLYRRINEAGTSSVQARCPRCFLDMDVDTATGRVTSGVVEVVPLATDGVHA